MTTTNHDKNAQLSSFIAHARQKGMDHGTIRALLLASGWRERDVITALADESLGMTIPVPPDTGGARDAFFHLLTSFCLYSGFFAIVNLFFDLWNRLFPDTELERWTPDAGSIRWFMATIIITAPLFFLLTRALNRDIAHNPEKAASPIRRWLTYLTLFLASVVMVGNLVTLVFYVLDGDLTVRFIAKVLTLFVLSGLVFTYYFQSLRRPISDAGWRTSFMGVGIVVTVLALVAGFWVAGSPATRRLERLDEQRVLDIRSIVSAIDNHVHDGKYDVQRSELPLKPLPTTIDQVATLLPMEKLSTLDPETSVPYEYTVTSPSSYDVCATFSLAYDDQYTDIWDHPAGRHCYSIDVRTWTGGF